MATEKGLTKLICVEILEKIELLATKNIKVEIEETIITALAIKFLKS